MIQEAKEQNERSLFNSIKNVAFGDVKEQETYFVMKNDYPESYFTVLNIDAGEDEISVKQMDKKKVYSFKDIKKMTLAPTDRKGEAKGSAVMVFEMRKTLMKKDVILHVKRGAILDTGNGLMTTTSPSRIQLNKTKLHPTSVYEQMEGISDKHQKVKFIPTKVIESYIINKYNK